MKIVIFGHQGQVAWELQRSLACLGEIICLHRHGEIPVDLMDETSIRQALQSIRPQLIVNAAAFTAVDLAQTEKEQARQINHIAPGVMAEEAARLDALLIHYSTDYVFAGDASQPYRECHDTAPQSIYGQTKLDGEKAIRDSGCKHLIFRTAWVYASRGKNFLLTMLRLMAEKDRLGVVADQIGAPTWSRHIAEATALVVSQCRTEYGFMPKPQCDGIYHLTNNGQTSWHGFASEIQTLGRDLQLLKQAAAIPVDPITTRDYPTPAKRPAYSVLDCSRLSNDYGIQLPDWRISLQQCIHEMR